MLHMLKLYARNKVRCQKDNLIEIRGSVRVKKCHIIIKGTGNKLVFHDGAILNNVIIEIDGQGCELSIGADCVIGEGCYFSCRERNTKLSIGDNCMFSRNVRLMTSDGHDILHHGIRINMARDISIGNHVWLADGVTVLKGVSIGDGAVVGINALLTTNVPGYVVAAGFPAKVIKENIIWREDITF
ncbi:acyltransferase [Aeromonas sobria]|uniref:acyltransferase n=1 Tax=Aeromonas sobria TaxID=646 RepID=UPI0011194641|nr:acyltransferase [Aeromonas sobria]TNH98325.1 hexapeptide transferase [Aeromonas sobria]